jgi:translation initiation factor IF-1
MVKNAGGNKTKGQARKFATAKSSSVLRISENEFEVYCQVTKVLGGPMCHVVDTKGVVRLCHIRGKFRGRGKRDNFISNGSWILIGLRDWEAGKESSLGKLENCDLLEVYNELDKDKLKNTVTSINWSSFIQNDLKLFTSTPEVSDEFEFSDERTEEYRQLIEAQLAVTVNKVGGGSSFADADEEEIDIDDI